MFVPPFDTLVLSTPGSAVLSAADVRSHGRITQTAEDGLIAAYVAAATTRCEDMLGMVLPASSWQLKMRSFPTWRSILIPRAPLVSITEIAYVDRNGDPQSFDPAKLWTEPHRRPPRIGLKSAYAWPDDADPCDAQVVFTLAMGHADVPELLKQLVRWEVLGYFEDRLGPQAHLDHAKNTILRNYRVIGETACDEVLRGCT